jgi:uncharacterized protein YjcR
MNKQLQKIEKQIQKLQAKAELIKKQDEPKLVPTGKYTLEIKDKNGKTIHEFIDRDKREATLLRNNFYSTLVRKMKQKITLSVRREFKLVA